MMEQDLHKIEEKSIFVLREANSKFKNMAALWSMGKDSTAMLALARKAFLGKIPFPVIHIDNGIDFPESYAFREYLTKKWNMKLIVAHSEIKQEISGFACCGANKTVALKKTMAEYGFDAFDSIDKKRRAWHTRKGALLLTKGQELQVGLQESAGRALEQLRIEAQRNPALEDTSTTGLERDRCLELPEKGKSANESIIFLRITATGTGALDAPTAQSH
jgi:hypothetical protein